MKQDFYSEIIKLIKSQKPNKQELARSKNNLCKKYHLKKIPLDIDILLNAKKEDIIYIKKYLQTKPTRTISGVAVVAIMTKPLPCPHVKSGIGPCSMCPGGPDSKFGDVPQSYTGKEPATRRAIRNNYDPYLQVMNRLEQYIVSGHVPDKIELIIMGGTFPSYKKSYKNSFIKYSFKAMNDFSKLFFNKNKLNINKFKEFFELPGKLNDKKRENSIKNKLLKLKNTNTSLEKEQIKNEKSNIKCVGLTIETRPDYGKLKHGNEMLRLGATRVELGVQTTDDKILNNINRGHTVKDSVESTKILKDLGFKINYHVMPGLPGSTKSSDLKMLKQLFSNQEFMPDMLKIYPCMVLKGTKLYNQYKKNKFKPITTSEAAKIICEFKKSVPEFVRIMRVQRDIPTFMTEAGVDRTNLRQYVDTLLKKQNQKCKCIRCREIKQKKIGKIQYKIHEYNASDGKEFFISANSNNDLVGFCRLRFPSQSLRKEIKKDSSLIRELHVYGPSVEIGKKGKVQHKGIGRKLLNIAEKISKQNKKSKIIIISGIGVRNYYRKTGYKKQGPYLVKYIK